MLAMIQPVDTFKENLALLPPIDGIAQIDLVDDAGKIVHSIPNQPGKQGSLALYHYLQQACGTLDTEAAEHGLQIFSEHVREAQNHPGAHPNVDLLLAIVGGAPALRIDVIRSEREEN